jgi:tight adherence protein C
MIDLQRDGDVFILRMDDDENRLSPDAIGALTDALQQVADRTSLDPLARFIDGLLVAIERGTPLAEVLRSQAADVREAGKRRLLEAGGRKEIAMMVPVVFLVLPVTVMFALFPGLISIVSLAP